MKLDLSQVIVGVVIGAILGIGGSIFVYGERITRLEEQVKIKQKSSDVSVQTNYSEKVIEQETEKIDPYELIKIIKEKQSRHVKQSYGTQAYESFTENDLKRFEEANIPLKIKRELKKDSRFLNIILSIKKLSPSGRQELVELAFSTYKRTWGEIGRISKDGQTDAGQLAEKMVSMEITNLVIELTKKSNEEIKKLYPY